MSWLSDLLSLIKRLFELLRKAFKKEPTREDFIEAIKELSQDPAWRARILKDALDLLAKKYEGAYTKWISIEKLRFQTIHRGFSCGLTFSFGEGIYAIPKEVALILMKDLQQDYIKYVAELTDCDNFATFFKGFADYVMKKPVVIYTTGLVLKSVEQLGYRTCVCKSDYLVGGHGWNRLAILEPIEYEITGTTKKQVDEFTLINYEPQNDRFSTDAFMSEEICYKSGGGLPIIYGEKIEGGDG